MSETDTGNFNLHGNGVTLKIYEGGEFTDEDSGEKRKFDAGIKIDNGRFRMKLTAMQLAFIVQATQQPDVKKELQARLKVEKEAMQQVGF